MTSKSKTLKTKAAPASKKPAAKVPTKVVKAVAAKKVISAKVGEKIKATIVPKTKVEVIKVTKAVTKKVAKLPTAVKKPAVKTIAKPVQSATTVSRVVPVNLKARSKLVAPTGKPVARGLSTNIHQADENVLLKPITKAALNSNVASAIKSVSMASLMAAVNKGHDTQPAPVKSAPVASTHVSKPVAVIKPKTMSVNELFGTMSANATPSFNK